MDQAWPACGAPWSGVANPANYGQLRRNFDPDDQVSVLTDFGMLGQSDGQAALMGWLADDQSGVIGGVWVAQNGQLQLLKSAVKSKYVALLLVKISAKIMFPSLISVYDESTNN